MKLIPFSTDYIRENFSFSGYDSYGNYLYHYGFVYVVISSCDKIISFYLGVKHNDER